MKKIFTILSIALMALCSTALVSCGSDDDSTSGNNDQDQKVAVDADITLYVAVTAKQAEYLNQAYNINTNGTTKTVSLSEMTQVKDSATIKSLDIFDDVKNSAASLNYPEFQYYSYNCEKMSQGKISVENMQCTIVPNHPKDDLYFFSEATFVAKQDGKELPASYVTVSSRAIEFAGSDVSDEANLVDIINGLAKNSQATLIFK